MSAAAILSALAGGALIGLASAVALVAHGRIAGITGIVARLPERDGGATFRLAFLGGLLAVGLISGAVAPSAFGAPTRGLPLLALAGVIVGVGTTLGNGCTSGHGICGLGRGSTRSAVAVATFMATGALTVALVGAGG